MIKQGENLGGVKAAIAKFYEKEVLVKVNLGRGKVVEYEGRLCGVYPSLFMVQPHGAYLGKTTYAYAEVLCGTVSVSPLP